MILKRKTTKLCIFILTKTPPTPRNQQKVSSYLCKIYYLFCIFLKKLQFFLATLFKYFRKYCEKQKNMFLFKLLHKKKDRKKLKKNKNLIKILNPVVLFYHHDVEKRRLLEGIHG